MDETKIILPPTEHDRPLSPNFNSAEFRCRCCNSLVLDRRLVLALQRLRDRLARPLLVTSGYRCPQHNREVGGVAHSAHLRGEAADIACAPAGLTPAQLGKAARRLQLDGDKAFSHIGVYDGYQGKHGFVHLGIGGPGDKQTLWGDL